MNGLQIATLGALAVRRGGEQLALGSRKQRALFALLVINRRQVVTIDRIVAGLWGHDAPDARRDDVYVYVSRLRRALGSMSDVVRRADGGYLIDVADDAVDAVRFEALVDEGRRLVADDPPAASLVLGEALAMWSGEPFGEFAVEDFARSEVARLQELRLGALEAQLEADLGWRDVEGLVPEIQGLVTSQPERAGFTAGLMLALYRLGRQAEALDAYRRFAVRLADETGLDPPDHLQRLEEQILLDDPVVVTPVVQLPVRLPTPIGSFVGRSAEISEVAMRLVDQRLVTVTGPGGVGKTALALEVARRLAVLYDDTPYVDLTRAETSGQVLSLVAEALRIGRTGGDAMASVLRRLGNRRVLLVLDNCELVAGPMAEDVAGLLRGAPGLRVLATSRMVLSVPGESVVRLVPLSTEAGGDAVRLVAERIEALPESVRSHIDREHLLAISAKTAGLPLAIELAVAQLRTWPVADVIEALDDPLETLRTPDRVGPEHHRDLEANIAWSERLLDPAAATLLARLSVFRSSFGAAAVVPVAGFEPLDDSATKNAFRRLVDASLVMMQPGLSTRYSLLEPVRHYAQRRLDSKGDTSLAGARHARYYVEHFEALGPKINRGTEAGAIGLARPDDENVRVAVSWAVEAGDGELAQRGAAAAMSFWRATENVQTVLPVIDAALKVSTSPSRVRSELLFVAAPVYALAQGSAAWRDRVTELQTDADALGDPEILALAALRRADVAMVAGVEPDGVVERYAVALDALGTVGSHHAMSALHNMAWYQYWLWDRWEEAAATGEQWLRLARAQGWRKDEAFAAAFDGWLALAAGDVDRLERRSAAAADTFRDLEDHRLAALQMLQLALGSLQRGDTVEALNRAEVAVLACGESGSLHWTVNALLIRATIKLAAGIEQGAADDLLSAADVVEQGDEPSSVAALAAVAGRLLSSGDPEAAAALLGRSEALGHDHPLHGVIQRLLVPMVDELLGAPEERLRVALGSERLQSATARGAGLDPAAAAALVHDGIHGIAAAGDSGA